MSILERLGLTKSAAPTMSGATETVRKIVAELSSLPVERARWLAAFAYVLGRVADADQEISEEETRKMEEIVRDLGHLPAQQAALVVRIAQSQSRRTGGTEDFVVTREFKQISDDAQKQELLDCLFAVSAADEAITGDEERVIRQIASELGLSHRQYVDARRAYSRHRTVLKRLNG